MRWMIDLSKQRKKLSMGSSLNSVQKKLVGRRLGEKDVQYGDSEYDVEKDQQQLAICDGVHAKEPTASSDGASMALVPV